MSNVPAHIVENYEAIRAEQGFTYAQMGRQFAESGAYDLAEWAEERAKSDVEIAATTKPKRTAAASSPKETR